MDDSGQVRRWEERQARAARLNTALWAVLMASVLLTITLGAVLIALPPADQPSFEGLPAEPLLLAAVVLAGLALALQRYRNSDRFLMSALKGVRREQALVVIQARSLTVTVLTGALIEGAAVLGFAASYLAGDSRLGLCAGAAAFLLIIGMRPDDRRIMERGVRLLKAE